MAITAPMPAAERERKPAFSTRTGFRYPQGVDGITWAEYEINVENSAALWRDRTAIEALAVRRPVKARDVRPTLHCELTIGPT
jgi:hypothetical protein